MYLAGHFCFNLSMCLISLGAEGEEGEGGEAAEGEEGGDGE